MNATEQIFVRKIFRQGDSLAVTIPSLIVKTLGLEEGDYVVIELSDDKIIIKKYFK